MIATVVSEIRELGFKGRYTKNTFAPNDLESYDQKIENLINYILKEPLKRLNEAQIEIPLIEIALREALTNSIEYGILDLDSSLRNTNEGKVEYVKQRLERLSDYLFDGFIDIDLKLTKDSLQIDISNNGKTFDFEQTIRDEEQMVDNIVLEHRGRGITIIKAIFPDTYYSDGGRTISLIKKLQP
jgi:anti-sigma regulatory factor (Ser/Thr protein kinase)